MQDSSNQHPGGELIDVVVVAAGTGSRMGIAIPKQYLTICNKTIIEHVIVRFFMHCQRVNRMVVVIAENDEHFGGAMARIRDTLGLQAEKIITATGGERRQDSVYAGLEKCTTSYVMVHDAARPFLQTQDLEALCKCADEGCEGAILCAPVSDTIKQGRDMKIERTVDRENLYRALTPQLFRREKLLEAYAKVRESGTHITDEAMAMELIGSEVRLVPSSSFNFKITTKEDLLLAIALFNLEAEAVAGIL